MSTYAPSSTGATAGSAAQGSDQFMWCHSCRMEIIPLRIPHPTCPHCNESFIEEINGVPEADNVVFSSRAGPSSYNRDDMYSVSEERGYAGHAPPPWLPGTPGASLWAGVGQMTPDRRRYGHDDGMGGAGGAADGRIFNHFNDEEDEDAQRADRGNPPIFLGGRGLGGLAGGAPPTLSEAIRNFNGPRTAAALEAARNGNGGGENGALHPDLVSLRDMFANMFGDSVGDMIGQFGAALGGRAGDYVFGEQGFNDAITGLMEQTQGQSSSAPPAASEERIEKLERFSRFETDKLSRARNHECPTCMDDFTPSTADKGKQPASEPMSDDDDPPEVAPVDDDAQQEELVLMPCQHVFHKDCLLPWLRKSGTCPVCRTCIVDPDAPPAPSAAAQPGGITWGDRTFPNMEAVMMSLRPRPGENVTYANAQQQPPRVEEAGPINWNNFGEEDDFPLPHFRSMTTAQLRASHAQPQPFGTTTAQNAPGSSTGAGAGASASTSARREAHDGRGTQGDDTDEEWQGEPSSSASGSGARRRNPREEAMERDRRTAARERMPGSLGEEFDLD